MGVDDLGIIVEIDLVIDLEGGFDVEFNAVGSTGIQIRNNELINPKELTSINTNASTSVVAAAKIGTKTLVVVEIFDYDLLGFAFDLGAEISGAANLRTKNLVCIDARLTAYSAISAVEPSVLLDELNIKPSVFTILDKDNSPTDIGTHLENFKKVSECTFENGGTIRGVVANADNRSQFIKEAKIDIENSDDFENERTTTTDENGRYTAHVPGGNHIIRISADGYLPFDCYQTVDEKMTIDLETFLMIEGSIGSDEKGIIAGQIINSVNGHALNDVVLEIRKGWNNSFGEIVKSVQTHYDGRYQTELPIGNYTIMMKKDGYVTDCLNVAVTKLGNSNLDGTMVPDGSTEQLTGDLRIVLTWDEKPRDLDSHLWGPDGNGGEFHTYFSNKNYSLNAGELMASLDYDVLFGYGPETTTIYKMNDEVLYSFYVYDFTNRYEQSSTELANSGAQVKLFMGNQLFRTINVPSFGVGSVCHVFNYDAKTNSIIIVNEFSTQGHPSYVRKATTYVLPKESLKSYDILSDNTFTSEDNLVVNQ